MQSLQSEEFRSELMSLLDKQLEVLDLSVYVPLTDEEKREFDERKQRIQELFQ